MAYCMPPRDLIRMQERIAWWGLPSEIESKKPFRSGPSSFSPTSMHEPSSWVLGRRLERADETAVPQVAGVFRLEAAQGMH